MDKERFENLAVGYIDGSLSADEQAEFDAYLAENPDQKKIVQVMQQTAAALKDRTPVEAPRHFAHNVMREVRARAAAQTVRPQIASRGDGFFDRMVAWFSAPRALAGIGAAAAVLALFAIYWQSPTDVDSNHISGTMIEQPAVDTWQQVDRQEIDIAGIVGHVSVRRHSDKTAVIFDVNSTVPYSITMRYDEDNLVPASLPANAQTEPGTIVLKNAFARAVLTFNHGSAVPADITMSIVTTDSHQTISLTTTAQ